MLIETSNFGPIEYDENEVIYFQNEILGFEGLKKYIFVGKEGSEPFMWLQSVENPGLAFVIINGTDVISWYRPQIPLSEMKRLGIDDPAWVQIYNIVVIPDNIEEISCNLKAPIVVNRSKNTASQIVLDDNDFEIRHYLKEDLKNYSIEKDYYKDCEGFIRLVYRFVNELKPVEFNELKKRYLAPSAISFFIIDMINGFCRIGPLSSPRVYNLEKPIFTLTKRLVSEGVKDIAFLNDSHHEKSMEFKEFPPHAMAGTQESAIVDSLKGFSQNTKIFTKNSLNAFTNPDFNIYVQELIKKGTKCFIIAGNCTDLCIYQTAMTLKMFLNSSDTPVDIIIPANCVDTFDSEEHKADLINPLFLYHLHTNGIEIVKEIK
ncbi:MAG: isochorismatase family protein [Thermoanaerobacteraceae bacterium]|nr:isochorismatase family protein [Thermoanaerobacteraceae bacterium]